MPIFTYKKKSVLFLHVPKCGGSSVEAFFRSQGCKISFKHNAFFNNETLGFPCSPQHFHIDLIRRLFARDMFDYEFAVVRHPLERLFSEFRMRMAYRPLEQRVDFNVWCRRVFRSYERNNYHLDNHIRPQVYFVDDKVEVFKLEAGLDEPLRAASNVLGVAKAHDFQVRENVGEFVDINVDSDVAESCFNFYIEDYKAFGYEPDC